MLGEKMSFIVNGSNKEYTERKINSTGEVHTLNDITQVSKNFKKGLLSSHLQSSTSQSTKYEYPKLYFKSTKTYTKVVAQPGCLPSTPKIFQSNNDNSKVKDMSNSFLHNLLSIKSFNRDGKERFSNIILSNNNIEKNGDKVKKEKDKKEENMKAKHKRSLLSEEEKGKKRKKQEPKELMECCKTDASPNKGGNGLYEDEINLIDLYNVVNKNAVIFHMQHPSRFSFHGEIKVTIISGEIEVLGYSLNSSSAKTSVDIYSPNFYTPFTVETKPVNQSNLTEVQMNLKNFLSEEDYKRVSSKLKPNDSVLYVEQIKSDFGIVINKYFEKQLFPKDLEDVSSTNETIKSLQSVFTFQLSENEKYFKKIPQWDKIPLGQCTTLCGGKGVGKSTLLKYYINKVVSSGEKVLCLDLDPGQPEFTFPGCVSAVVIDEPVLGPNFTHIKEPFLMMYFGDVDVTQDPTRYLDCVKYVVENCKKNEELVKLKWFINTMGFCKGLGVNLMITILKLISPDTVIQINDLDYKNNYPFFLSPTTVNSKSGYSSMLLDNVNLSYDLRLINSYVGHGKKQMQGGLKQRELRDVLAISYFSQMISPPFYNFNAVQPYLIPFSKLYLGIDFLIHPSDVLKAFNGNIVSLSHIEPDTEEIFSVKSEEEDYFKILVKPKVAPSFGLGFVRGIDCKEKKLYMITHLQVDTLDNVNCLSLGRVSPPQSMFLRQDTVEGQTVYTTEGTFDVFQSVRRLFRVSGAPQNREKAAAFSPT